MTLGQCLQQGKEGWHLPPFYHSRIVQDFHGCTQVLWMTSLAHIVRKRVVKKVLVSVLTFAFSSKEHGKEEIEYLFALTYHCEVNIYYTV